MNNSTISLMLDSKKTSPKYPLTNFYRIKAIFGFSKN